MCPGTQALIHGGAPRVSLETALTVGCVSLRPGPPKQVQPRPPEAASSFRASTAFCHSASKRITWWTIPVRCGRTYAEVTNESCVRCGSSRKQW